MTDATSDTAYRLTITVDDPERLSPAVHSALEDLAAALAADESESTADVSGFVSRPRVEIGTLAPRSTGPIVAQPNGYVCLGFSWESGEDPSCGVFWD